MDNFKRPYNKLSYIPFEKVEITDNFWSKRQIINREVSIHLQYEKLEQDHHIDNFRVAAVFKKGVHLGEFYFDSDLYKWLEATFYILHQHPDNLLEEKVNEIINLIRLSQLKDGYINTFYSTKFIQRRFTNLTNMHELYCAGHLIQAAIAHYNATGSKILLDISKNFVNLIVKIFLRSKRKEVPGHENIEMALIELYRITNNLNFLELAKEFINKRGRISNLRTFIIKQYLNMAKTLSTAKKINKEFKEENQNIEFNKRGEISEIADFYADLSLRERIKFIKENLNGKFMQLNVPVREIIDPVGHAVRLMYLFCGMADLYSETGDQALLKALKKAWLKIVKAKMYVTGGIGSIKGIEGFEKDFTLKNNNSYSETCAAIGNIMWNWRMLQITGNSKYSDLIEKLIYNAMLVGQSIDGRKYSYKNPIISNCEFERQEWFLCACCPPNFARIIASIGQYIYGLSQKGIYIHQYIGSKAKINFNSNFLEIVQNSEFPWKGDVKIMLNLKKNQKFSLFLRIPQWSNNSELIINNERYPNMLSSGNYIEILRNWLDGDLIKLNFDISPRMLKSDPRIKENRARIAISSGPLIYCLEQKDNKDFDIFKSIIPENQELKFSFQPNFLEGVNVIQGRVSMGEIFTAIPYYAWNNRGLDKMQVWHKSI